MTLCDIPAFSIQVLIAFYPQSDLVSPAFDNVRMTDKRPTSQHVKKEVNYAIRGDPKSLNQLSSSGKAAQSRRGKTLAQEASEASSSRTASSEGSNSASKGGNGQKK